ncbi:DEAD/DEAH box helicase [Ravibacter arvi]|uniref:DEAD/DEAH box helicase n=1 Tax=Ravibacter arvi TaxID=2051041 RepID=A0ABP8M1V0_9BACT
MENQGKISFEDLKLNRQLLNAIEEAGYSEPTPIQQEGIPMILAGHDVLGIAQTGTGKTAAFVLPLLMKLKYPQGDHVRGLILAPTRELVLQTGAVIEALAKYTGLRYVCLFGGIGPTAQIDGIRKGVDVIVSTPGRFMDLYLKNEIVVKQLNTLVLDEADKMMDMGFMPQIRRILEVIPRKRQNLLFSATFPEKVERLSAEFLEYPSRIEISPQATTAEKVGQILYEVPNFRTKVYLLEHLLEKGEAFNRVMVFTRTKETANNIFKFLERKVLTADEIRVIHANKGQNTRINAMNDFKNGNIRVLVTTDVTARGIDVTEVSHVINFDVPLIYEDYVHRIGRTGRAHHQGSAITFLTIADEYHIAKIEDLIRMKIPRDQLPDITVAPTPFEEKQAMLREIDNQRRREDPDFKGAFHEKKARPVNKRKTTEKKTRGRKK